jgi:hypothetical protein
MVERNNGFFETSFLPGRHFASPADFNDQLAEWLTTRANTRTVRAIRGRPVDMFETDRQAMTPLPPVDPQVGLTHRIRLARDYYVRVDANDYSVDPRVIGRFVDLVASPTTVEAFCDRELVARHVRSWARHGVITDPAHVATARQMRLLWPSNAAPSSTLSRAGRVVTATATRSRSAPCPTTTPCSASTSTRPPRPTRLPRLRRKRATHDGDDRDSTDIDNQHDSRAGGTGGRAAVETGCRRCWPT